MSKDMQKERDAAKKEKLPLLPKHKKPAKWAGIHGACTVCGCAIHECECK